VASRARSRHASDSTDCDESIPGGFTRNAGRSSSNLIPSRSRGRFDGVRMDSEHTHCGQRQFRRPATELFSAIRRIPDFLAVTFELWRLPRRFHRLLATLSLPQLLDEIEAQALTARSIRVAPHSLSRMVQWRGRRTYRWGRRRCLLRGLLFYYLLSRSRTPVTLHFSCQRVRNRLVGHCWATTPGSPGLDPVAPAWEKAEIFAQSTAATP